MASARWLYTCGLLALLFVPPAGARCNYFRQNPPVPIWRSEMRDDPRFASQFVFLSQDKEEIVLRYWLEGPAGTKKTMVARARIRNRIAPVVGARVARAGSGFAYSYSVKNRDEAMSSIRQVLLAVPDGVDRPPMRVGRWRGPVLSFGPPSAGDVLLQGLPPGRSLYWLPETKGGLNPGESEDEFRFVSDHRPGFVTATLSGWSQEVVDWPEMDEPWPDEVTNQLDPLLRIEGMGCHELTLGPAVAPGEPAAQAVYRLALAMKHLLAAGQLQRGSPFVQEVEKVIVLIAKGTRPPAMRHAPRSKREMEIGTVLELSFGLSLPSKRE
jgi:hypothetical protein